MSNSALIKSSIAKKYWMALTGLFLCTFLLGHLIGNLQLLLPKEEAREAFNSYALFMTTNPLIKILSWLTYISIVFHAIDGIALTIRNKKARPINYSYNKPGANSVWTSRYMGILGLLVLGFIIFHMADFWREMHFEIQPSYTLQDGTVVKDLYSEVYETFKNSRLYVFLYVFFMAVVGFHLSHGFQSAFQSLGLNHKAYTPVIKNIGMAFAIIVSVAFAIIPLYIHLAL